MHTQTIKVTKPEVIKSHACEFGKRWMVLASVSETVAGIKLNTERFFHFYTKKDALAFIAAHA